MRRLSQMCTFTTRSRIPGSSVRQSHRRGAAALRLPSFITTRFIWCVVFWMDTGPVMFPGWTNTTLRRIPGGAASFPAGAVPEQLGTSAVSARRGAGGRHAPPDQQQRDVQQPRQQLLPGQLARDAREQRRRGIDDVRGAGEPQRAARLRARAVCRHVQPVSRRLGRGGRGGGDGRDRGFGVGCRGGAGRAGGRGQRGAGARREERGARRRDQHCTPPAQDRRRRFSEARRGRHMRPYTAGACAPCGGARNES